MQHIPDHSLADLSAFDEHYGLEGVSCDESGAVGTLRVRPHHLQPTGVVHGGVYASMVEALASFATNWHVVPTGSVAIGMQNSTSFLRPCRGGSLRGRADALHSGRTTWLWDVAIRDDDARVCAVGRVTLAIRALGAHPPAR